MVALRCLALLGLAAAEFIDLEASSLLQAQVPLKRQDHAAPSTVHASASRRDKAAVSTRERRDEDVTSGLLQRAVSTARASILGFGECDVDRTMSAKGEQNFQGGPQTSVTTGNDHQIAGEDEFAILDKINEARRAGFNCTDPESGKVHVFAPQCRSKDLLFDCRLWFAAKQHSEDMGRRSYYSHETQAPFPSGRSGSRETFTQRVSSYAWGVAAHKELIMASTADMEDTPEAIVQSWLRSYEQCMALGTKDGHLLGIGRAPCSHESGRCLHHIEGFTDGLMSRRGWFGFAKPSSYKLDTSCYPDARKESQEPAETSD